MITAFNSRLAACTGNISLQQHHEQRERRSNLHACIRRLEGRPCQSRPGPLDAAFQGRLAGAPSPPDQQHNVINNGGIQVAFSRQCSKCLILHQLGHTKSFGTYMRLPMRSWAVQCIDQPANLHCRGCIWFDAHITDLNMHYGFLTAFRLLYEDGVWSHAIATS